MCAGVLSSRSKRRARNSGVGRQSLYASSTSSGIATSGSLETSCSIRPSGKIGVRSDGPAGSSVCGFNGGAPSPGRSTKRLTHCAGMSRSESRNFTGSVIAAPCSRSPPQPTAARAARGAAAPRRGRVRLERRTLIYPSRMAELSSRVLSRPQLEMLAARGEERTAETGAALIEIGDRMDSFVAILDGEVAVRDGAGNEIARHDAGGFLGEINLLSGQTVFVTAVALTPLRYIAVDRDVLRALLFDDPSLSDLLLTAFVERRELLQRQHGIGVEVIGPHDSADTRRLVEFARALRLPYTWVNPGENEEAAELLRQIAPADLPLVRIPGGTELHNPSNGELSRALGIGRLLGPREDVDLLIIGGGPGGLGAAVYGASEGLDTLIVESTVIGGQAGSSRRIENYLGFPAGISGAELTSRAATQARKFHARIASPYRAQTLEPGGERHVVKLDGGNE